MYKIIICLILVCLIYWTVVNTMNMTCVQENSNLTYKKIYGTRIDGIKLGKRLGLPTINLLIDSHVECGVYEASSHHGPATIFVGNGDKRKVFVNFMIFKDDMETVDRFEFWNIKRIVNKESEFVNTYNKGCCPCRR